MIGGDWFGGKPWVALVRLILICFVVGVIMSTLELDAWKLVLKLFGSVLQLVRSLELSWLEPSLKFILLGATVVLPIWLVATLIRILRGSAEKPK